MNRIALTDINGIYGFIEALEEAKKLGLELILGAHAIHESGEAILLVENEKGYKSLCHILSSLHTEKPFSLSRSIRTQNKGLIILSSDRKLLFSLQNVLPKRNLFSLLRKGQDAFSLFRFAKKCDIPSAVSGTVYFVSPEEFPIFQKLRSIFLGSHPDEYKKLEEKALLHITKENYFTSPEEIENFFSYAPQAIKNTLEIAGRCQTTWNMGKPHFPSLGNKKKNFRKLLRKCVSGLKKRYGSPSALIKKRLRDELKVIKEKNYVDYFLIVEDIVRQSSLTCGRGSAAASLVSFLLEITHVDPIRHNLFFDRFLSPARKDFPDIDIDFAWDERDEVIQYVFQKYGRTRVAMIANHNFLKARSSFQEIGKMYGSPVPELSYYTKRMTPVYDEASKGPARSRVQLTSQPMSGRAIVLTKSDEGIRKILKKIVRDTSNILGRPRNMSLHSGGIVIVPDDIRNYVPVEISRKGVPVIQWEKDQAEEFGLIKIDLLGNRSLAVIRDALRHLRKNYGISLSYSDLKPLDDPETRALIKNGDTMGVFYVESPAMRLLQKKAKKDDFEHLVIHSSIIRPAANRWINEYLERLHGKTWKPLHPLLEGILDETYGIMSYQEDVTKVAMAIADFTADEGETLRKVLTKKSREKKLPDFKQKFYSGAKKKGVFIKTVDRLWDMILSFSGYSFCKPHSASYALVSFKSAYLRAHYPAEFMASVISNGGGYYSTQAYIHEAKRMGISFLLPDINESEVPYVPLPSSLIPSFIRVGFMQIRHNREDN